MRRGARSSASSAIPAPNKRTDAVTYASVVVLVLVAALLACAILAMRAARVDPLSAIRDK